MFVEWPQYLSSRTDALLVCRQDFEMLGRFRTERFENIRVAFWENVVSKKKYKISVFGMYVTEKIF